jgi:RNA polymerase sigma-70 factor, ECF subfamily
MSVSLVPHARVARPPAEHPTTELYRAIATLGPELSSRARYLTRDHDAANDLVQDSVERALKFASNYQPGTNVRAWLSQVMFSVFVSRCRRQHRQREVLQLLGNTGADADTSSLPPESATIARQVHAGLRRIPPVFAEVVKLVDLEDLSYREAADTLELPLGTVMSRLHRGRHLLRAELELAA